MMVEETITTEYFAGAKIVHEVQKKTLATKIVRRSGSDDIQSILPMPVDENWGFEIHRDNVEDSELVEEVENRFDEVTMEEENDDKENQEPGLGRSIDEMDWDGMVVPRTGKRKHFEDLV
jgi:regulator of protease activity HflC (stomatin/prohibitin superfamily)